MKPFLLCLAIIAMMALPGPARSGEPNWPDHLTIGTASPGGTYYVYGEGLAKILTRVLELPVANLTTAKALGLAIPERFLLRANELIE